MLSIRTATHITGLPASIVIYKVIFCVIVIVILLCSCRMCEIIMNMGVNLQKNFQFLKFTAVLSTM